MMYVTPDYYSLHDISWFKVRDIYGEDRVNSFLSLFSESGDDRWLPMKATKLKYLTMIKKYNERL